MTNSEIKYYDPRHLAGRIYNEARQLRNDASTLIGTDLTPGLGVLAPEPITDRGAQRYMSGLINNARSVGVSVSKLPYDVLTGTGDVLRIIKEANHNKSIHGILPMLPFPEHLRSDEQRIINAIDSSKDVDAMRRVNGEPHRFLKPTPEAVWEIMQDIDANPERYNVRALSGTRVAVVGLGNIGGSFYNLVKERRGEIDLIGLDKGDDLSVLENYNVIVSATGRHSIKPDNLNRQEPVLLIGTGDEFSQEVKLLAGCVAEGFVHVSRVNTAIMFHNVVKAAVQSHGIEI